MTTVRTGSRRMGCPDDGPGLGMPPGAGAAWRAADWPGGFLGGGRPGPAPYVDDKRLGSIRSPAGAVLQVRYVDGPRCRQFGGAKDTDENYLAVWQARETVENGLRLGAVGNLISTTVLRTVTEITLPRAKRQKRSKTGCARGQLTTLYPSLS